jgi:hypothetical protein
MAMTDGYDFPSCPRCQGLWTVCNTTDDCLRCLTCRLHFSRNDRIMRVAGMIRCHIGQWCLQWYVDPPITLIYGLVEENSKCQANIDKPAIRIHSWLPFDITAKRLRLLVLFS